MPSVLETLPSADLGTLSPTRYRGGLFTGEEYTAITSLLARQNQAIVDSNYLSGYDQKVYMRDVFYTRPENKSVLDYFQGTFVDLQNTRQPGAFYFTFGPSQYDTARFIGTGLGFQLPAYGYTLKPSSLSLVTPQLQYDYWLSAFGPTSPPKRSVSIFDRVLSTPFISTFVENPISAITKLENLFSNSPGDNVKPLFQATVGDVPKVDFKKLGLESGVNTIANVGFAFGVQGVSQGISAGVSASTPLSAGTYGPVSPGFWSSLGSGNFGSAYQIAANTLGVATGGPTTFLSRQGANVLLQQGAQLIVKLSGDIGKGILQLVSFDFSGALQSFGVLTPPARTAPNPGTTLLYGPSSGGGGGGGGGFLPSTNTGQSQLSNVIIPIMGLGVLGLTLWYFLRKKA
jgi:hypothetical protein